MRQERVGANKDKVTTSLPDMHTSLTDVRMLLCWVASVFGIAGESSFELPDWGPP